MITEPDSFFYFIGNLNMPYLEWNLENIDLPKCIIKPFSACVQTEIASAISDVMEFLDLSQLNQVCNDYGSLRYIVLSNCKLGSVSLSSSSLLPCDKYLPTLLYVFNLCFENVDSELKDDYYYSFKKLIMQELTNILLVWIGIYCLILLFML